MIRSARWMRRFFSWIESVGSSSASIASRRCESDSDGFESPPRRAGAVEEEEAQHRDGEVAQDRAVLARLEVREADLLLAVLEEPLDVPARERDGEKLLDRRRRGRVREEVLLLMRQDVLGDHEPE